jgi:hypothetical protein
MKINLTHLGKMIFGAAHRHWLLLAVLLVAVLSLAPLFPHRVTPASASPEQFSGERAMLHLPIIAREAHPSGSPAQAQVRDYLVGQLTGLGLETEVQAIWGVENVLARLEGSQPGSAILLQAHYDSRGGPAAADNGAGVAALLEVARALTVSPAMRNDIIFLFDDSEEIPDAFTGTKAFIAKHPWMADVRVAVGMDTAVRGFIAIDDTGPDNGWMVGVLAKAYNGGAWTSLSGGGGYDTEPFRDAGIRVLELEDNYPFYQQHTPADVAAIVNPGSVQQLGEQALVVVRTMGDMDLSNTSGEQETFFYVPVLGLAHYPQTWALLLAILAGVLVLIALGLALWQKTISWRGLGVASLATLVTAGIASLLTSAIWKLAPGIFAWQTRRWTEWPEVIPPHGWLILILTNLLALALAVIVYRLVRRWSSRAAFSLFGLLFFFFLALVFALADPRGAMIITWPVLIGALSWIGAVLLNKKGKSWAVDAGAMLAAIPVLVYILTLIPAIFMGDGTKSVAITTGVFVVVLSVVLPVVDC